MVCVTHDSAADAPGTLAAVAAQLEPGDEIVVVDNASGDGTAAAVRAAVSAARMLEPGRNLGFAAGCHAGAEATTAPLLLFINPDATPAPGCLDALRAAAARHPGWGAWQALVVLPGGRRVNTRGGVTHFLGFGWAGGCEQALRAGDEGDAEVSWASGAALVVRRALWDELGGFDRDYFMYGEDLELGLRLWLAGHGVGVAGAARVQHAYDFDKGARKWFLLERNRWRTVLATYPAPLLALVLPALLAFELALLPVAARAGWLGPKLASQRAVLAGLPAIVGRRRRVQATRVIGAGRFAERLTAELDSPYLAAAAALPRLVRAQALYWSLVRRALS